MKTVRELAAEIVAREGGFVDDPDDPGGATNHGVTIHSLRRLGIDITGDGRVDVLDVRRLSRARAIEIYIDHYFRRPGIGALPEVLQPSVFDMYVNAGANAVKILQRLCSQMGFSSGDDGVIGPPRTISPMPMGLPGAITITLWPMPGPPVANLPAAGMAARAAGLPAPRSLSRRAIT
jgi:lysozyme family protein